MVRGSVASIRNRARNITDDALRILEGRLEDMDTELLVKVLNAVRPLAARPLAQKPAPKPPTEDLTDVAFEIVPEKEVRDGDG